MMQFSLHSGVADATSAGLASKGGRLAKPKCVEAFDLVWARALQRLSTHELPTHFKWASAAHSSLWLPLLLTCMK